MSGIHALIGINAAPPAAPLVAGSDPGDVSGFTFGAGPVNTGATTCLPGGGYPPYTYAWTKIGTSFSLAANTPTAATTYFTGTTTYGGYEVAVFKCTVTDNIGQTAEAFVNVSIADISGGGGGGSGPIWN